MSQCAKFSTAYEDEDEDKDMEESHMAEHKVLEEAAKKASTFKLSVGFTFAKEVSCRVNQMGTPLTLHRQLFPMT